MGFSGGFGLPSGSPGDGDQIVQQSKEKLKEEYPHLTDEDIDNLWTSVSQGNKVTKKDFQNLNTKRMQEVYEKTLAEVTDPKMIEKSAEELQNVVNPLVQSDKEQLQADKEGFKSDARALVTTDMPGLTDNQRRSLQETANSQINTQVQNYKRMLGSSAGRKGMRGGAALAPQMEVAREGLNAQNQFQRDLVERDTDLAMRRLAAYLASIEGQSAQQLLTRGQWLDFITGRQQQGKQEAEKKYYENIFNKLKS